MKKLFSSSQRIDIYEDYDGYLQLTDGNEMHLTLTIEHAATDNDEPLRAYLCIMEETTSGGTYNQPAHGNNSYADVGLSLDKAAELLTLERR